MPGSSKITDQQIDDALASIKEKMAVKTNFADAEVQAAALEKNFKFFDTDGGGYVDHTEFVSAMTRLNFVGVQGILEALFDTFDESGDGIVTYREFALTVFGLNKDYFNPATKCVIERVKMKIIERGASGVHTITKILRRMDRDGSYTLGRDEFVEGLMVYGIRDLDEEDVDKLMGYFDRDGSGRISIEEFLRGVKGKMSRRRKKFVKMAFNLLDKDGSGKCEMRDFKDAYDTSAHPAVQAGQMTADEAIEEFMSTYEFEDQTDGVITFAEFMDYYKGISCGIQEDDYFELMMRNAWHISGGEGWCANSSCLRVLVRHSDRSQEVCEVENDLGLDTSDMEDIRSRLERQGVQDIMEITLSD